MRQIFSVRFFAAVGGVAALFFVLTSVFATRAAVDDEPDPGDAGPVPRVVDLVELLQEVRPPVVVLGADGTTTGRHELLIDASRALVLVPGTVGEVHCDPIATPGGCALVVDLLGEAIVWFAVVPAGAGRTVPLPAIDTLDEGIATLVNGWQVPYASVLDRRCPSPDGDEEFASYRELRETLGDDFTAVFDVDEQQLTSVVCRERVPYAPLATTAPAG